MVTEIYKYLGDKVVGYDAVKPGDYRTIANVASDGSNEIIVAYCRDDNACTVVFTIHPESIKSDANPPHALYRKEDSENRALIIRSGAEETFRVRERMPGSKKLATASYRLAHR